MKLEDLIKKVIGSESEDSTPPIPILLIDSSPAIKELNEKSMVLKKEFMLKLEKIRDECHEIHVGIWGQIEQELLKLGLLTEKEIKNDIKLQVRDGVIFKG